MMDAEDRELFEQSLRAAVDAGGTDLDPALADLGWLDALAIDPQAAVAVLFPLQGRAGATSSALSHVVRDALGVDDPLPVVLPALGQTEPPGRAEGNRVVVRGLASAATGRAVVVVAGTGGEAVAGTIALDALAAREVHGLDPVLGLVELTGETMVTDARLVDWIPALGRAQLAVGHELVGASRRMLELAREHALNRIQFGQPIARFQAVRHRLAEALVAVEMADALLAAAWDDTAPESAAIAKAVAGRSARTTARHCQQVLAGMGFTTEHDLHRYVRRVYVLDELLGSSTRLTSALGRHLVATRSLPAPLPL
ncbi:MAG TPA: acyl-CoA dehydrogenase family protein [Acidimicrobiia bacterium]|jgi:hypothetical protein